MCVIKGQCCECLCAFGLGLNNFQDVVKSGVWGCFWRHLSCGAGSFTWADGPCRAHRVCHQPGLLFLYFLVFQSFLFPCASVFCSVRVMGALFPQRHCQSPDLWVALCQWKATGCSKKSEWNQMFWAIHLVVMTSSPGRQKMKHFCIGRASIRSLLLHQVCSTPAFIAPLTHSSFGDGQYCASAPSAWD